MAGSEQGSGLRPDGNVCSSSPVEMAADAGSEGTRPGLLEGRMQHDGQGPLLRVHDGGGEGALAARRVVEEIADLLDARMPDVRITDPDRFLLVASAAMLHRALGRPLRAVETSPPPPSAARG